jgi:hypothetical protein
MASKEVETTESLTEKFEWALMKENCDEELGRCPAGLTADSSKKKAKQRRT